MVSSTRKSRKSGSAPGNTPRRAERLMQAAMAHHRDGNLVAAEQEYMAVVEEIPAHLDALHNLATLMRQSGRPVDALGWMRRAAAHSGGHPLVHCNLANMLREQGQLTDAVAEYRKSLAADPA